MQETIEAAPEVASELVDRAEIRDGQAIVTYSHTEAALADLRAKYKDAKYDLTTTAGDRAARAARHQLVTLRGGLEDKRKEFKAPALEFGRKIDAEAARIKAEIMALEDPIDAQIKADEKRREEERRAKEEAEAARKKVHTDAIAKIARYVEQAADLPSERIANGGVFLLGLDLSGFEEFTEEATATRDRTIAALQILQAKAKAREDEEARLAAERVEQERIAAEQAETAKKLKEQQEELERQRTALEAEKKAAEEALEQLRAAERRAEQSTMTHANGAPMFGEHIKANGDHVMLDDHGKRSVFCDVDEGDEAPLAPAATPSVIPMPTRAPAAQPAVPSLKLGEINARLAGKCKVSADDLANLGFPMVKQEGAAKLWREEDWPAILGALIVALSDLRAGRREAA